MKKKDDLEMNKMREMKRIAEEIRDCPLCKQWGTGKAVPGEGSAEARIVFIGEAPGREEAVTGRPFIGRSGKLLRAMIREIGLDEQEVFITSPVHYLPLRGTPTKKNVLHSRNHLQQQLAVINPSLIVLLGNTACFALLDRKVQLTREHGSILQKGSKTYLVTFHPAYALRFPEGKKGFIRDFETLKGLIEGEGGGKQSREKITECRSFIPG